MEFVLELAVNRFHVRACSVVFRKKKETSNVPRKQIPIISMCFLRFEVLCLFQHGNQGIEIKFHIYCVRFNSLQ